MLNIEILELAMISNNYLVFFFLQGSKGAAGAEGDAGADGAAVTEFIIFYYREGKIALL